MNTAVVGLGFGDEGKGKIVDILSEQHDIVVRYNGGANAGHTVVVGDVKHALHLLPCGVIHKKMTILAGGMAIDPRLLMQEISHFNPGCDIGILVSKNAHCVMPWHFAADARKGGKIGTTVKGIGPCYADKMHRWNAVRMGDLLEKLESGSNDRFFAADEALHGKGLWDSYHEAAKFLQQFLCDTGEVLRNHVKEGKNILFESANGIHLDIDHGGFPYVTSSGVGPAAIPQSCGLPNLHLDRIVGVIKAYSTRVGEGPFPSEILRDDWAHEIRERGGEYGTTTGRPRRIGWLDLDATKRGCELTGATEIMLMHVDTLCGIAPKVLINNELRKCKAWHETVEDSSLVEYIKMIENHLELPITGVSHGPERSQMGWRK